MESTTQNIIKLAREVKALCDLNTCYFQEIYDYVERVRVRDEVEAVHVTYNPDKRSLKFFCNNDCKVEDGDVWFFTVLDPDLKVSAVLAGDLIEVSRELASAVESL